MCPFPGEPLGGPARVGSFQLFLGEWKRSIMCSVDFLEGIRKEPPARLSQRVPDEHLPGIFVGCSYSRSKHREQVLHVCVISPPLELETDAPERNGDCAGSEQHDHAEYFRTLNTVSFGIFDRPFRNSSSTRNASACTLPPSLRTSAFVAAAVPPVASTSSMIRMR